MKSVQTGDVYWAVLEPVRGSEQAGRRPVGVFQNPALSRFTTTALSIPLTTNTNWVGVPGTFFLKKGDGGLPEESVVLAFQMRALDPVRLRKKIGKLSAEGVQGVSAAVLDALGIEPKNDGAAGSRTGDRLGS